MAGGRAERTNDLFIEDDGLGNPNEEGQVRHTGGDLVVYIGGSVKSLTAGAGGGISEAQHKALRQLIHFIDDGPACGFASGAYKETLPAAAVFPTSEIWWESAGKLKKIVSLDTTWSSAKITAEVWKVYDTDGSTVLCTVTDAISYSGVFETSRTRTIA